MAYKTSGNAIVDQMGSIAISGNIIPQEWYKSIVKENGRPHFLAIMILGDIVYWYRPTEDRDERTGEVIGWRKKFKGDILQKNYQQYATLYGESKRVVKGAMDLLEKLGLIRRHFQNVSVEDGGMIYNQMFVTLEPERLIEVTYPADVCTSEKPDLLRNGLVQKNVGGATEKCGEVVSKTAGCDTEIHREMVLKTAGGDTENWREVVPKNAGYPTENCIHTNNTTETTYTDYPSIRRRGDNLQEERKEGGNVIGRLVVSNGKVASEDQGQAEPDRLEDTTGLNDETEKVLALVKDNIAYEVHMLDPDSDRRKRYDELYQVIRDTLVGKSEKIRIGETDYPYEVVKSRLLKLDENHLCQVRDGIARYPGEIRNMRKFMLASLYNAPATMETYYRQRVYHDFYGDRGEKDE